MAEIIFFRSDTLGPFPGLTTRDGKIDFVALGERFKLEPKSIQLCGNFLPRTKDNMTELEWKELKKLFGTAGTAADPVTVGGDAVLEARTDLVVQNEKARNVDLITRANEATKAVKKRSGEYIEKHGESKRPTLFQEPLWHCVPNFSASSSSGLDYRFTTVSSTGVMVMGRSALGRLRLDVYKMITRKLGADGGNLALNIDVMLVHGPMGSGKSRIVLLLIWDLAEEFASRPLSRRVRIIPITDCQIVVDAFVADSVEGLLDSFIWAFADDEKSTQELGAISDLKKLKEFLRNTQDTLVYVLDQWQVLENNQNAKTKLISIIKSANYTFQVRVTSAGGEELKREVSTSHNKAHLHPVSGGIKEDEMASFNLLHGTGCETKAVQALVDEQLGRNPFMLAIWRRHWYRSRSGPDQPADQSFLNQFEEQINGGAACIVGVGTALSSEPKAIDKDLPEEEGRNVPRMRGGDGVRKEKEAAAEDVTEAEVRDGRAWHSFINSSQVAQIRTSIESMLDKLNSDIKLKADIVKVLWSIVFSSTGDIRPNRLGNVNLRYFVYDSDNSLLSCAFPLVRAELARYLDELEKCKHFHDDHAWYALKSAVSSLEPPSVVGLFAERCCNAAIAVGGGHTVILGRPTKRSPIVNFFGKGTEARVAHEAIRNFMESGNDEDCFVFLPKSPYYEAVDNIVVRLYKEKKASNEKVARKKTSNKAVKKKAVEGDICMDLAMTQVTLQSMEKHSVSTISAMAPEAISPWIVEVNGKVQVTMAYVVPGQTIHKGTEKETVPGCSPKPIDGERGAQRRQVEHTLLRIPFGNVHENLKILDKWSSQKRLA